MQRKAKTLTISCIVYIIRHIQQQKWMHEIILQKSENTDNIVYIVRHIEEEKWMH